MNDTDVLTVEEVATRLRARPEAVRRWLRDGRLRGFRPGGKKTGWRIRATDVEQFIEGTANIPDGESR